MLNDVYHFLYVTNREITFMILTVMIVFDLMILQINWHRVLFVRWAWSWHAFINAAWMLSWFSEPPRIQTLEPIIRETAEASLLLLKGIYLYSQFFPKSKIAQFIVHGTSAASKKNESAMRTLIGLGGMGVALIMIVLFFLFSTYRHDEEKQALKAQSEYEKATIIYTFNRMVASFEAKLDAALRQAKTNEKKIEAVQHQGETGIALAQKAAVKADLVASTLKAKEKKEAAEKSSKTIRTPDKIDNRPKKKEPGLLQKAIDYIKGRHAGLLPSQSQHGDALYPSDLKAMASPDSVLVHKPKTRYRDE